MSKKYLFFLIFDTLNTGDNKMDLYFQNDTLFIDILQDLDEVQYRRLKMKIFRIIEDYGVDKVIIENHHQIFHNRHLLRQIKQDFHDSYAGEFLIK